MELPAYIKESIGLLSKTYDSFYIYDERKILSSVSQLKSVLNGFEFLYSIKANPNEEILQTLFNNGIGSDSASKQEVILCHKLGLDKSQIFYSSLGKTYKDINATYDKCIIIADSLNEINLIQRFAKEKNIILKIGVRINPQYDFNTCSSENYLASKFGIDEVDFMQNINYLTNLSNIKITGIHIHLKSQILDTNQILSYYKYILSLVLKIHDSTNIKFDFVNLGSCIGILYPDNNDQNDQIDFVRLSNEARSILDTFKNINNNVRVIIETGRFLVCESGYYVTTVLDKKKSAGRNFVILCNTLNGFIRPSLSILVNECRSNADEPYNREPLYTCKNPTEICVLKDSKDKEKVTLVGNLCTATDVVAQNINLPKLQIGDIVIFTHAGTYARVLSPLQFSLLDQPFEYLKK